MNKIAIITGGTKGIGRAIIYKFVKNEFDIITCSRSQKDLENLKYEVEQVHPESTIHIKKADLSIKSEVMDFAAYCMDIKNVIELLINNTGVFIPGQISNEPEGNLEIMMNTNLYSAYHLTRGILPSMIKIKYYLFMKRVTIVTMENLPDGECPGAALTEKPKKKCWIRL